MRWTVSPVGPLKGEAAVPGDKSITHRAFLLGALASGEVLVRNPLLAEDTENTLSAVGAMGVRHERGEGWVRIHGRGFEALEEPGGVLDMGNSGTGARLFAGLLAGRPFFSVLTGDASLRRRPMRRVVEPLRRMGASIDGRSQASFLPLSIRGGRLAAIDHASPVASAQVKSCVLLAALQAKGTTRFTEPELSRDHTERMLARMGVTLHREGTMLTLAGGQGIRACDLTVPGDLSSAAFFLVAASALAGSRVTMRGVGVNPTRTGILDLLQAMGAQLTVTVLPGTEAEPVADITAEGSPLAGVELPSDWVPRIIDELPIAAVAAAAATGVTTVRGAEELRAKESDRIASTAAMLRAAGVVVREYPDGFEVEGGVRGRHLEAFESRGDHRIAMASAVLALIAGREGTVRNTACVATSFPGFPALFNALAPGAIAEIDGP